MLVEVRIPELDLEYALRARDLGGARLRFIDLHPPAAGPEIQLGYETGEASDYVWSRLEQSGVRVLAIRIVSSSNREG